MGKWTDKLKGVPKAPPDNNAHQLKVDEVKAQLITRTTTELVAGYVDLRRQLDKLEEQQKALNLTIEAFTQLLVARFEAEDVQSVKQGDGALVSHSVEPYPGVKDREALQAWCIEHGLLSSLQLPWSTLASMVKDRLNDGEFVQCDACKGLGVFEVPAGYVFAEGETNDCKECRGSGQLVLPGVRVFLKDKLRLTGR